MNAQETRKFLLYKLNRDWPALRIGLRNGRKLNRLSTRQLERKYVLLQRIISTQRATFVGWLDNFQMVGA